MFIKMTRLLILYFFIVSILFSQNEWKLQSWLEVKGTRKSQALGLNVASVSKNGDYLFKAVVGDSSKSGFYTLINDKDTLSKYSFVPHIRFVADFNDDKYFDVLVRKHYTGSKKDTVYIYWGNQSGIESLNPWFITEIRDYGLDPSTIGDINNDGKVDLIISSYESHTSNGTNSGKLSFFLNPITKIIPDFEILGDSAGARLGYSTAIGDLNGDSYTDLVVRGYTFNTNYLLNRNYFKIFLGNKTMLDTIAWKSLISENERFFGQTCFDISGDGKDDLIVVDYDVTNSQAIKIYYQKNGNIDSIPSMIISAKSNISVSYAEYLYNAGDINGDGYNDLITSYEGSSNRTGDSYLFVYCGGPKMDTKFDAAIGLSGFSDLGSNQSVIRVGDVNNDGCEDILAGAPGFEYYSSHGYFGVFLGSKNIKVTSVEDKKGISEFEYNLFQNYPNPFNGTTVIKYKLVNASHVNLKIYDLLGKEIEVVVNKLQEVGDYNILFDGIKLKSGIYFSVLILTDYNGRNRTETRKMVLIK